MCHLILLLPILSLALFWILPLGYALPAYAAIVVISAFVYWLVIRAMRRPVHDGFHSLVGGEARVVARLPGGNAAKYLVRTRGELWRAYTQGTFQRGEQVKIAGVKGIALVVERKGEHNSDQSSAEGIRE